MKRMMSLFLMVALIMGFSFAVMGATPTNLDSAKLKVNIEIEENAQMAIVTNDFIGQDDKTVNGLFNANATITGDPGYYISDGNATANYAREMWDFDASYLPNNAVNTNAVEMLAIDANTAVTLTMKSDFDNWPSQIPLFFRLSSHEEIGVGQDTFDDGVIDINNLYPTNSNGDEITGADSDAELHNVITQQGGLKRSILGGVDDVHGNEVYAGAKGFGTNWNVTHAAIGNEDDFGMNDLDQESTTEVLPFRQCTPYLIHVNGGLYLDKIGMVPAGQQSVEIEFIVAAAVDNGDDDEVEDIS